MAKQHKPDPAAEQVEPEIDLTMEAMLADWREREHRLDVATWQFLGDDLLVWVVVELLECGMWSRILSRLSPELVEVLTAFADQRLSPSTAPRLH